MGVVDRIKGVGFGVGGLVGMLVLMAVPVVFIYGMTWVSMKVFPWLTPAFFLTLTVCVFLLGPMSFIAKTRWLAAVGFLWCSYVFGTILWIWALLLTFELWGMIAVVIGLLIVGIGIVPVALLASLFRGEWAGLGNLVIMILATFGFRILAIWLASKADRERQGIYG